MLLRGEPWTPVGADTESGALFSSYFISEMPPLLSHTHSLFFWMLWPETQGVSEFLLPAWRQSLFFVTEACPQNNIKEKKKKAKKGGSHTLFRFQAHFFLVPLGRQVRSLLEYSPCHTEQFRAVKRKE